MSESTDISEIWAAIKNQSASIKSLAESQSGLAQGMTSAAGALEALAQDNADLRKIIAGTDHTRS